MSYATMEELNVIDSGKKFRDPRVSKLMDHRRRISSRDMYRAAATHLHGADRAHQRSHGYQRRNRWDKVRLLPVH